MTPLLRPNITPDFRIRRARFESLFPAAHDFLVRLERDGPRHGLVLSTAVNAHLYKHDGFLAYLQLGRPRESPPRLRLSPRYNLRIVDGTRDCSRALFPEPLASIVASRGGEAEGWLTRRADGAYELSWATPAEVFAELYDVLVHLRLDSPQRRETPDLGQSPVPSRVIPTMPPANLRTLTAWSHGYEHLVREERNLAAILYAALLDPDNVRRLLAHVGCDHEVVDDRVAVFYEYAYLRDLWSARVKNDPALARRVILELLAPPDRSWLESASVRAFNAHFGVPNPSDTWIQSPSNWSIKHFAPNITDDDYFLRVCRFKWAFNAKPDIVIHTSPERAVCIEAKLESGEGKYPSKDTEKAELRRRGLERVGQTDLQKYMLEELLGIEADFVFLVDRASAKSATHRTVTWRELFDVLDLDRDVPIVRAWLDRLGEGSPDARTPSRQAEGGTD